jgi:hypothetical protein
LDPTASGCTSTPEGRVRFYARPDAHGTATTRLKTVTPSARRFGSSRARPSVPRC